MGSSSENFTLALHKSFKFSKKIKIKARTLKCAWAIKNEMLVKNGTPVRLPVLYEKGQNLLKTVHV